MWTNVQVSAWCTCVDLVIPVLMTEDWGLLTFYRFSKDDMSHLAIALSLPNKYFCKHGTTATGTEALMIMLRRLTYPNRLCDLVALFGHTESELSLIFATVWRQPSPAWYMLNFHLYCLNPDNWWCIWPIWSSTERSELCLAGYRVLCCCCACQRSATAAVFWVYRRNSLTHCQTNSKPKNNVQWSQKSSLS